MMFAFSTSCSESCFSATQGTGSTRVRSIVNKEPVCIPRGVIIMLIWSGTLIFHFLHSITSAGNTSTGMSAQFPQWWGAHNVMFSSVKFALSLSRCDSSAHLKCQVVEFAVRFFLFACCAVFMLWVFPLTLCNVKPSYTFQRLPV